MESLIVLFVVVLIVGGLVGPILAIIALVRTREIQRLTRRVAQVEAEIFGLRRAVEGTRKATRTGEQPPVDETPPRPVAPPAEKKPPARPAPRPVPPPSAPPPPAPPPPSATVKPPPPAPPARARIDWERWVGIRGAAVLGAIALGLAGLLFFKYSIERGLITPTMRVVLGTVTGLGCLVGSRVLRARGYRYPSDAVAGAGVVVLYAAFWAAHVRYGLIGPVPAYGLMVLVTLACCVLAMKEASLLVAVLGLIGGFATPLLLSTGSDRPIGLFGYILLLDLGLLFLATKRNWPSLGLLSLAGTVLLEALWIGGRMGPDRLVLGLVILGVFALLFVGVGRLAGEKSGRGEWAWSQLSAIVFPFAFALYFAARVELAPRLYPVAILLALLSLAAGWLARQRNFHRLGLGAAAACVAVVAVWLFRHEMSTASAWEVVAVATGLSLVFHLFVELDPKRAEVDGPAAGALVSSAGFFILLLIGGATAFAVPPWPWLAGWTALSAILYVHARLPERAALQLAGAIGLGLGLTVLHQQHLGEASFPSPPAYLALMVVAAIVVQAISFLRRGLNLRLWAMRAAATLPILLLVPLAFSPMIRQLDAWPALGASLLLGALTLMVATRLGQGTWYAGAVVATALVHWAWTDLHAGLASQPAQATSALLLQFSAVLLFTGWLFLSRETLAGSRVARWTAALAGPIWFLPMLRLFEAAFGEGYSGLLPIVLGVVSLGAVARARGFWSEQQPERLSTLVWFSAVALGFLSVAIPLQLDKEWITIGWALEGVAVIVLWKRLDHPGLKYFGLILLSAATVRLVANPALLGYYQRSGIRIFNWLLYTYLVPAGAMLGSAAVLRALELVRLRDREKIFYPRSIPFGAVLSSVAAIVVIFVWINLAIADWFSTGPHLTLSFGAEPAQRLTVSIVWAIYALLLLGLGMFRGIQGLRWISLAFLLVTIGKVFLYDLGQLRDLYRVASLVGLAISLILVSVLYQRFVFRDSRRDA